MSATETVSKVARGFDAAAPSYDDEFDRHPAGRWVRRIMQNVLQRSFNKGDSVLEMGCGTGTDAVFLAEQGVHILATDSSSAMLEQAERKARQAGVGSLVMTRCLDMGRIGTLEEESFDGAFSNFGGLNCLREPAVVAQELARLIHPGGHVVLCLMSGFCLWETLAFLARGRFAEAFRRRKAEGTVAHVHGESVQVYYHRPGKLLAGFASAFELVEMGGLNILTPPPSSRRAHAKLGSVLHFLEKLDDLIYRLPLFRCMGDHYYVVLRRNALTPFPGGDR